LKEDIIKQGSVQQTPKTKSKFFELLPPEPVFVSYEETNEINDLQ